MSKSGNLFTPFNWFRQVRESLLHLAYPHVCTGCGTDVLPEDQFLCAECLNELPKTDFEKYSGNPVEKIFWGRLPLVAATAQLYFTRHSAVQNLMHQLKYRGQKDLGVYLGKLMGHSLMATNRFKTLDAIIPLPLFPNKERKRGYNQATVLCEGISQVLQVPVLTSVVIRTTNTETQTNKNRVERWQNIEGRFEVVNPTAIEGKHLLLVDDVVTTGATLESCGRVLTENGHVQLSIATLCYSSR